MVGNESFWFCHENVRGLKICKICSCNVNGWDLHYRYTILCCVYLALGTYITLKFKICRNRFVKTIKKSSVIFNCLWWVYFEACLKWKLINIGIVTTSCAEWLKGNSRANEVSLFVVNPIFGIGVLWEKIGDLRCGNLPSGLGKNSNNFGQSWGTGHG